MRYTLLILVSKVTTNMSDIGMLNLKKLFKWQLPLLFAFIFAFSIPVNAGKVKLVLAPPLDSRDSFSQAEIDQSGADDRSNDLGPASDYGFVFDFSQGPNAFAVDYYSISTMYKGDGYICCDGYSFDVEHFISSTTLLLGYRRHTSSGFYLGGGVIGSNIARDFKQSDSDGNNFSETTSFRLAPTIAFTFGYDHSFNNGLVLGTHWMRSLEANAYSSSGAQLNDLHLQFISFGIGYDW